MREGGVGWGGGEAGVSTDAERGSGTEGRKRACEGGRREEGTLKQPAATRESNYSECRGEGEGGRRRREEEVEVRGGEGGRRLSQISPLSSRCRSRSLFCLDFPPPKDLIRAHPAVSACSLLLLGGGGEGGGSEGETTQQSVHLPGQSSSRTEPTPAEHTGASNRLSGVSPAPSPPLSTPVRVFLWMLPQSRDDAFVTHTSGRTPRTSSTGRTSGSNLLCSKTALPAARRLCVCVSGCVSACSSILCLTVYCRTFMHLYIYKKKKF